MDVKKVAQALCEGHPLPDRHKDHRLTGWTPPVRECHVRPDVLLICRLTDEAVELVRLGSHSDLF